MLVCTGQDRGGDSVLFHKIFPLAVLDHFMFNYLLVCTVPEKYELKCPKHLAFSIDSKLSKTDRA